MNSKEVWQNMKKGKPFEFDSAECAAVARDLAILQTAECDRAELNFSVRDLEIIMEVAKGNFAFIGSSEI